MNLPNHLQSLMCCNTCKSEKSFNDMASNGVNRNRVICKVCKNKKMRARRSTWLGKLQLRAEKLKSRYGITFADYSIMFASQDGCCAICNISDKKLHIDHNHSTNLIRGLLCSNCNMSIGLLKESEKILLSAIEYLRKSR